MVTKGATIALIYDSLLNPLKYLSTLAVPSPLPVPQGREHPQITLLLYHHSHRPPAEALASSFLSHTPLVFPQTQSARLKHCSLIAN